MLNKVDCQALRVRASALDSVMAKAVSGRSISAGAVTYAKDWYIKELTGKNKLDFGNKYTRKGHARELEAIELVADCLGEFSLEKNEKHYEDEHFTGTPDVVTSEYVLDIKSPWSVFTFPWLEKRADSEYIAQVQCYMALTGLSRACVAYVLADASDDEIQQEAFKLARSRQVEVDEALWDEVAQNMTYSNFAPCDRVKLFWIDYDPDYIQKARERVQAMRDYLSNTI